MPNMKRVSNVLLTIVTVEVTVVCFWLISDKALDWESLGLYSIYSLWFVLPLVAIIYELRRWLADISKLGAVLVVVLLSSVLLFFIEVATAYIQTSAERWLPDGSRFLRMWLSAMIIMLVVHRAWHLLARFKILYRVESESRIQALQARIQPHFLFNSLNTISELSATVPDRAEEAIQSLAMLFRVSLENKDSHHSLDKELALCKRYISLESWRYNGGIDINYNIDVAQSGLWMVPKLILQPIIENAIKYGHPAKTGQPIALSIRETRDTLSIKVTNMIVPDQEFVGGNGIAIKNIKDRLFVLYDDRYTFSHRKIKNEYIVLLQMPKFYDDVTLSSIQ